MDEQVVKTIEITCKGHTLVSLSELTDLQGNLKDLTEANYLKLRNSILSFGFSFPVFYWQDNEGKKWIVDSHQRRRVLTKMQGEGYTIPPLPADEILAIDKAQAKQKLLLLNSRFGEITQEGWDEFVPEVNIEAISDLLEIPEMEQNYFEEEQKAESVSTPKEEKPITCPSCGNSFVPKKENLSN